jgi:hypothetical protein
MSVENRGCARAIGIPDPVGKLALAQDAKTADPELARNGVKVGQWLCDKSARARIETSQPKRHSPDRDSIARSKPTVESKPPLRLRAGCSRRRDGCSATPQGSPAQVAPTLPSIRSKRPLLVSTAANMRVQRWFYQHRADRPMTAGDYVDHADGR